MEEVRTAGFWVRLGAGLLDGLIVGLPLVLVSYLFTGTTEETPITSIGNLLYLLIVPVIWSGYTIGKRIVGVRIVRMDGGKIGIGTMLLRTLAAGILYWATFGVLVIVSVLMVVLRDDKRAIHDFIAKTKVIYVK
ncbi:RDD family protein [Chungangia koreensis]|uniref:RDD family protein n=1 Tax=Chungangia koreensis TaxID=752657 RepID=A0ABV8X5C0_9LACT